MYDPTIRFDTDVDYSPWSLLPAPDPSTVDPPIDYFYHNVAKHLIRDTVRIMSNGLPIDLERVSELEEHLDTILDEVQSTIDSNPLIIEFQKVRYERKVEEYKEAQREKFRQPSYYLKPFKYNDMTHRSYFMHLYCQSQGIDPPSELLPTGIPKWPANLVKRLSSSRPVLQRLLNGELDESHPLVTAAMQLLAEHRVAIYNRQYEDKIASPEVTIPPFNLSSPPQKQQLFDYLGYQSDKISKKTGLPSWDRKEIERILHTEDDPVLKEILQCLVDFSFAAIIRRNFIESFYKFTVDGRLYGNYRLFGAKSFRYTSNSPNMLNSPSTGSKFAKPVKRCLIAPSGKIIYAIDLSALEDRVMACLSKDTNKLALFTDGLDGHCLNAYGYFKEEIAEHMELTGDTVTDVKRFFDLQENGHEQLADIRQRSKPATFGLSYGAFPKKVASSLKITIEEATDIFNRYHQVLYPGVTKFREDYVLPTATANGRLHLGLGCYLRTDSPDRDIRTLTSATCQFWSIITALTINRMHQLIDTKGLSNDIKCISTIYDSIYYEVTDDIDIIKWLNDNIVPAITQDFVESQAIPNAAAGEIGYDWASLKGIPVNATSEQITEVREKVRSDV